MFDPSLTLPVLCVALLVERIAGYPDSLFQRIAHPVVWIGALIGWLDRRLNRDGDPFRVRRLSGLLAVLLLLAVALGVTVPLALALRQLPGGWILEAVLASSLLAQRSLDGHVAAVSAGLRASLADGRRAVSMIVGRDPECLDRAGVARAACESLAENFSDGVVAPAVWLLLGGLPGIVLYKAINTADSMIGHRSPRFLAFGWAAARLDDVLNLPGARLTAGLLTVAAWTLPGADAGAAGRAVVRDAGKHRSPNAGWPEAALAGALGFRLAGPRRYGGTMVEDAWMGDGRTDLDADDIDRARRLVWRAWTGLLLLAGAGLLLAVRP